MLDIYSVWGQFTGVFYWDLPLPHSRPSSLGQMLARWLHLCVKGVSLEENNASWFLVCNPVVIVQPLSLKMHALISIPAYWSLWQQELLFLNSS